jgi:uncharacterized protein YukJ
MAYTYEKLYTIQVNAWSNEKYYNLKSGGKGGTYGIKMSEDTKLKISIANKGKQSSNKGKKLFNLNVLDYTNQLAVEFFSRKYKIDVTPELLDFIEHQNLDYKVEKEVYL